MQTAETVQDPLRKDVALESVAVAQAEAGDVPAAFKTAEGIRNNEWKAAALREIGKVQAQATIPPFWKSQALRELAAAQVKLGDVPSALRTAGSIQNDSQGWWQMWAFRDIAVAQAAAGDINVAFKTVAMMKDESGVLSGSAARWVVGAQAKRGVMRAAIEWADSQKSPSRKALALLGVAEGILERVSGVKRQDSICRKGLAGEWFSPFIVC